MVEIRRPWGWGCAQKRGEGQGEGGGGGRHGTAVAGAQEVGSPSGVRSSRGRAWLGSGRGRAEEDADLVGGTRRRKIGHWARAADEDEATTQRTNSKRGKERIGEGEATELNAGQFVQRAGFHL